MSASQRVHEPRAVKEDNGDINFSQIGEDYFFHNLVLAQRNLLDSSHLCGKRLPNLLLTCSLPDDFFNLSTPPPVTCFCIKRLRNQGVLPPVHPAP
ncbi:hypothetical protein CDAR_29701 [Caerostris darwini]|uniref:Uncharacterized protein n=1 Tax=Caerostris darwini TaxID=1538125 RepID=A0AAV4QUT9_9ARAC|nr:hypothetical protein CDAR_29701 [Caerostris darwini]